VIFVVKYVSAMVFGGGILGGARKIWGNPYLNSTTVLFDMKYLFLNCVLKQLKWQFSQKQNYANLLIIT